MADYVVIVTGGGRGIGRAVCQRFADAGAQVIAASRSDADLEETRSLIEKSGGRCQVQATDVSEPDDVGTLIEGTAGTFGRIDALVQCAGVAPLNRLEELDPDLFKTILSVNVTAVYHGCRAVWPVMRRQGGGVIINISSVASADPFPGFAAYGASKAWVNAWTRGLAEEGKPQGIRVFSVAPGAVETRMLRDAFPDYPAEQTLRPADVADVVYTLSRPEWRYTTGQTVFVRK